MEAATSSSEDYSAAISTVATSQICQSVGFRRAEPAAVRCLSDILGRYLRSLASLAAAGANSHGRTNSNLLDIIQAAELLHAARGFPGAGDPRRSLLHSKVLKDIASFVSSVDEIPFSMPLRQTRMDHRKGRTAVRFRLASDTGFEPPHSRPHVPRWLPMLPPKKAAIPERRREESLWPDGGGGFAKAKSGGSGGGREVVDLSGSNTSLLLPLLPKERRERVRFRIGGAAEVRIGGEGRTPVFDRRGIGEEEESRFCVVKKKLRLCDGWVVSSPLTLGVKLSSNS